MNKGIVLLLGLCVVMSIQAQAQDSGKVLIARKDQYLFMTVDMAGMKKEKDHVLVEVAKFYPKPVPYGMDDKGDFKNHDYSVELLDVDCGDPRFKYVGQKKLVAYDAKASKPIYEVARERRWDFNPAYESDKRLYHMEDNLDAPDHIPNVSVWNTVCKPLTNPKYMDKYPPSDVYQSYMDALKG